MVGDKSHYSPIHSGTEHCYYNEDAKDSWEGEVVEDF